MPRVAITDVTITDNCHQDCHWLKFLQSPQTVTATQTFTHFRHVQMPSENSPFQIAHQHPYHAAHLVTASASDSVSLLNLRAL